jgi:hypothetical protein
MVAAFKVFLVLVVVALMLFCQSAFSAEAVQTHFRPDAASQYKRLTWEQEKGLELVGGQLLEAMANATPAYTFTDAFMKQFMKQVGVQMQVEALQSTGQISTDPPIAFIQGFLIGL